MIKLLLVFVLVAGAHAQSWGLFIDDAEGVKEGQPCIFNGVDNVNKTLITCDGEGHTINLHSRGITSVNANAFDNNTDLTELYVFVFPCSCFSFSSLSFQFGFFRYLHKNKISTIPLGFLDENIKLTHL